MKLKRSLSRSGSLAAIGIATALVVAAPAFAQSAITIDFENTPGYFHAIADFYNGGTDSLGRSGVNYGVSFSSAAAGLSNDALGPYYAGAPSAATVLVAFDSSAVMNVAAGFVDRLSFYYASDASTLDAVTVWSGPDATGTLLASASLFGNAGLGCSGPAYCRFDLTSVMFAGTARSVSFGGNAGNVLYDNVSITTVPEPATFALFASGLLAVGMLKRRRHG
ncbi:MAG: PEP-CTERM sorting domain-containing protein [Rubrivivax sp.]